MLFHQFRFFVKNEKPDLSGVVLDGWDVRETLKVQSKWNGLGAVLQVSKWFFEF